MKNTIALAVAASVMATSSFAVSIPSGTAITTNAPTTTTSTITMNDVCSFADNMVGSQLNTLNYFQDVSVPASPKHYLYGSQTGANRQILSGYLTTANYSKVIIGIESQIVDSFAGGTQTTQAQVNIGGASPVQTLPTVVGNSAAAPVTITREEPLASGYTPLWINDFIIESTSGFSTYATSPQIDVTVTCSN